MNNIIIVGGSQSHIPFIESANNLGYNTIVFDMDENCEGAKISDSFYKISTHDINQIISECSKINDEKKIKGVMTYSSSTEPLFAVARTCEKIGLPSFSSKAAELATNKELMKECFVGSGISTPEWIVTDSMNIAVDFTYEANERFIIKPSSGTQGSMGVLLIDQESDISKNFEIARKISHDSKVILEKYYSGREFSVDGIVVGDLPVVLSVSEKFNLGNDLNFTMCGFSTGKIANDDEELLKVITSIKAVGIQAAAAMEISNSFFSVDILVSDERLLVLECGILLDCKIDRMLNAIGIDVYDLFVNMIAGRDIVVKEPVYAKGYGLSFLFADQKGRMSLNKNTKLNNNITVEWEKQQYDLVSPPKSIADTLGWIIASGSDMNSAYDDALGASHSGLFRVIP